MSRKSPGSKPKSPKSPAQKKPTLEEQRITYFLGYITQVNRATLTALLHLSQAPDCQVTSIPSLVHFDHEFEKQKFHARGFVTNSQAATLEEAADESIKALLDALSIMAKSLYTAVIAGARDLAFALEPAPISMQLLQPEDDPPPGTGCCSYKHAPPVPNMPQLLCTSDPDYFSWAGGVQCPPGPDD